ncbi:hypothetical protein Ahia01_000233800 [Argonauta hians]
MDARLRTLMLPDRKLGVTLAGFYIDEDPDSRLWLDKDGQDSPRIKPHQFLTALSHWSRRKSMPEHDHAMFFTTKEIFEEGKNSMRGYSPQWKICTNDSVSVVQDRMDFSTITMATHQLAHSLGAHHDGDLNPCRSEHHYVMSGDSVTVSDMALRNMWNFSSCSTNSVVKNINRLNE